MFRLRPEPAIEPAREKSPVDEGEMVEAVGPSTADAATASLVHALERAPIGVALFDADGRLLASNAAAARLWRLEPDQLKPGATLRAIIDALRGVGRAPERSDFAEWRTLALRDPIAALSTTPLWSLPDGDALRVMAEKSPDGGFLVFISDETGALGLERRFKTLQGARQATIAAVDQGLAVVGAESRVQLINPAFVRLWGLDPSIAPAAQEGAGPSISTVAAVATAPEDKKIWRRICEVVGSGVGARRGDSFTQKRSDGRVVSVRITPLPDGAVLIACADVTDAHRIEAALRDRNAALETADRVKTEFLAAIGSQLRTPLNSVIGFAELLREGVAGPMSDAQLDYLANILTPAHDLRRLISDALDLGALEAGSMEMRNGLVDMRRLIVSVADMLSHRASARGARILADPPREAVKISGDETRLKQAVFGAACTALANAEKGDVVALVLVNDGVEAVLRLSLVAQNPATAARVSFEEMSGERSPGWVALSLTRRIVELHRGVVEIEENAGSQSIAIRLPALALQESAA